MPEPKRPLTPANQNPWYVLMTLYGEQDGEEVDWELHKKNREAWNAWACQGMSEEKRREVANATGMQVDGQFGWQKERNAILQKIHDELQRRNKDDAHIWQRRLPDPNRKIDLSAIRFDKILNLHSFVFPTAVLFNDAIFHKSVDFENSIFLSDAYFDGSYFKGKASFDDINFLGDAWFQRSACDLPFRFASSKVYGFTNFDQSMFGDEAIFVKSHFSGDVHFSGVKFFNRCNFRHTNFDWQAFFSDTDFNKGVEFNSANFKGLTEFSRSHMAGNIDFQFAIFEDRAFFTNTSFRNGEGDRPIRFSDCHFGKPANFNAATFHSTYPDFSGTVLHDRTTFSDKSEYWPTGKQADPKHAKASCAVIRHNLGRQGLPEAEHFFFRREMEFAGQADKFWEGLPYRVFGILSDYGYSIARPATWLIWCWFLLCLIFAATLVQGNIQQDIGHLAYAAALSFANLFPLFGFQKLWFDTDALTRLPPLVKAIGGLQTVVSLPLLFFLALGLRTRFRMR